MKWLSGLVAAALLLSKAMASPVPQQEDRIAVYKLRIATRSNAFLDGKYLSVRGDTVGIYDSARPLQFYTRAGSDKGLVELHTYPIGIVDSVIGLVGSDGLMQLTELSNPGVVPIPRGTRADWTSWSLQEGSDDRDPRSRLTYAASRTGRWVAFPVGGEAEWKITWLEGTAFVTTNYMPIEVTYELATNRDIE